MKAVEVTIKGTMWIDDDASDAQVIQAVESVFGDDILDDDNPQRSVDWIDYDVQIERR